MDAIQFLVDFVLHVDEHLLELASQYGTWIYLVVFVVVFCETGLVVTPFLPGDSLLFAAGVLSAAGVMDYGASMLAFLLAGCSGDAVNYSIGRRVGPAVFQRDSRLIKRRHLLEAHAFYLRHGGKAIVLARFVPIVRTFAPFVAGVALMPARTFFAFNVTGCLLWVGGLVSAGHFLGGLEFVRGHFNLLVYAIVLVSVLPVAVGAARARLSGSGRSAEPTEEDYLRASGEAGRGRPNGPAPE